MTFSFKASHISAGLTAVLVGYSSAVIIVLEAATASGANAEQAISWLVALGIGMGVTCIGLSWYYKMPVVTAWSTPGAVFLIGSTQQHTLSTVTGALVLAGVFAFLTMQLRFMVRLLERLPTSLCAAMLAGLLLPFCLRIFSLGINQPEYLLIFLLVYLCVIRLFPQYVMLSLLCVSIAICGWLGLFNNVTWQAPTLIFVKPEFTVLAMFELAIPLYLITMLSQNLPGIAILHSYGYRPSSRVIVSVPSLLQVFAAPFGGFTFNLAAITASLCMSEGVDSNANRRYWAGIWAGIGYVGLGVMAASVVTLFGLFPPAVTALLAGFALIGTLLSNMVTMLKNDKYHLPAMITFLCCASGISVFGVGAAVWGLLLGGLFALHKKTP